MKIYHGFDMDSSRGRKEIRKGLSAAPKSGEKSHCHRRPDLPTRKNQENQQIQRGFEAGRFEKRENDVILLTEDCGPPFVTSIPEPLRRDQTSEDSVMKKFFWMVLLASVVPAFAAEENLALNKAVTASSVEKKTVEEYRAVDGNPKTRWASQFNDQQWFMVDLGSVKKVGRVVILWEKAYGKRYKIQLSTDQKQWKDVVTKTDGKGGKDTLKFPQQDARYVRFAGDSRGTWNGYSFWEFQVFEK